MSRVGDAKGTAEMAETAQPVAVRGGSTDSSGAGAREATDAREPKEAQEKASGAIGAREGMGGATVAMRRVFAALCAVAVAFATMSMAFSGIAGAIDFDDGAGYAEEWIGNEGWRSDLITEAEPGADVGDDGQGLVQAVSTFLVTLGVIIISVTMLLTVARFAGRGLAAMFFGDMDAKGVTKPGGVYYKEGFWRFFMTSEERASSQMKSEWFFQMCKESVLFLCIGLGAGFLVMLLAGIGSFVAGTLTSTSSQAGLGDFDVSGIHVTTK